MPNYTYICKTCGDTTEVWHYMSDQPEIYCALCTTTLMVRKPNLAAVTFNGTGFYSKDK